MQRKGAKEELENILSKFTMEERRKISDIIAEESNYYIFNYLNIKSNARIDSISDFTEYLQSKFDLMTKQERYTYYMNKLNDIFPPIPTYLKRVK